GTSLSIGTDRYYGAVPPLAHPHAKIGQGVRGGLLRPAVLHHGRNLSIARALGGLATPDRPVTDRHRGVTVRYGMVHRLPRLMNTWEGNSIGLADAAGQMV